MRTPRNIKTLHLWDFRADYEHQGRSDLSALETGTASLLLVGTEHMRVGCP